LKPTLLGLVLAFTALQSATPARVIDPVYTQLRSLKLSGETIGVEVVTLKRDAATLVFNRGVFHFAEPINGKVMAAVFIGEGQFRIEPPTDVEKRNMAGLSKDLVFTEPFSELVVHFTDGTFADVTEGRATTKGPPDSKASSIMADRMNLIRKGRAFSTPNIAVYLLNYNLPARLLEDVYDPAHAGFFNAFIKGNRFNNLMFRIDPRGVPNMEPEEVVLASFDNSDLGIWNSFHLADHYGKQPVADEDNRLMDIQHQEIDATIRGTELQAKVRTSVEVRADGPRVLSFDLFKSLRVKAVRSEDGRELQFIQEEPNDDPMLAVIFPQPLKRGKHRIEFEYAGDGALHKEGSGNYTLDSDARANWYPSSSFGDRATYDMVFHFPKDLVMVASGQPLETSVQGNNQVAHWKSDIPLAVAGFNFGQFKKSERKDDKTKYLVESYANTNMNDLFRSIVDRVGAANFNTTRLMDKAREEALVSIGIYQNYFGPLPYGRLAITQQAAINYGQAWPMLIYLPITAYFDSTTRHEIGFTDAADFFKIVGPHEVAHQWWGHLLGWKSYRDQWMSEGFAEFSASLFAHLVYGDDQFREFWKDQRRMLLEKNQMGKRPVDVAPVVMGYRADNARSGNVTRRVIYPKGGYILHMLRMMMYDHTGKRDERFIAMMRDFVTTHHNQNVSTEDFKRVVEKHMTADMDLLGTRNMDWFFNQYVYGTAVPKYKLDYQLEPSGTQTILTLRLTQSEVPDNFRMAVPVYLEMEDKKLGKLGAIRILGNSQQQSSVKLGFRPKRVFLCAFEDVLADFDDR